MSTEAQIIKYLRLIEHKVLVIQRRLEVLDQGTEAKEYLDKIQPIVDKLGCCPPVYCLPKPCNGDPGEPVIIPPVVVIPPPVLN